MQIAATRPRATDGPPSEDALLLREFSHRAFNEVTVASSAVAVAGSGRAGVVPADLLREAADRLRAVGDALRVLARPVAARVDLGGELGELCRAMRAARGDVQACALELDLPETIVDGALARRVGLIAAELVANAFRHGLAGGGVLAVSLDRGPRGLLLRIEDRGAGGPAAASSAGMGLGSGIVASLAETMNAAVGIRRARNGTVAEVMVPLARDAAMRDAG